MEYVFISKSTLAVKVFLPIQIALYFVQLFQRRIVIPQCVFILQMRQLKLSKSELRQCTFYTYL